MRPKCSITNIRKALRHPRLILLLLKGYGEIELAKEHVAIHLRQASKMEMNVNGLDSIDMVCRAIDLCSNSCYDKQYLYLVCLYTCPELVVETGVHYGVSSSFILKALEKTGGRLYSIDLPNVQYQGDDGAFHLDALPQGSETGFVIPEPLKANWELIIGDSRKKLPELLQFVGNIDIFHHDSTNTYDLMTYEYETVWPYLKNDGLLISDDADWNNAFEDFCHRYSADYTIYRHIGIAKKST